MPENKSLMERVAELLNVEYLPPLDPSEVQALRKALPGYQAIADDTGRLVQDHAATLHLSPAVLADSLIRMAHFRNLLVHQYEKMDIDVVCNVIKKKLDDLVRFGDAVCGKN